MLASYTETSLDVSAAYGNDIPAFTNCLPHIESITTLAQSITFEASDRSRSLPLALIHIPASELSLAPIREIAR